jgi:hypothetical protein
MPRYFVAHDERADSLLESFGLGSLEGFSVNGARTESTIGTRKSGAPSGPRSRQVSSYACKRNRWPTRRLCAVSILWPIGARPFSAANPRTVATAVGSGRIDRDLIRAPCPPPARPRPRAPPARGRRISACSQSARRELDACGPVKLRISSPRDTR